MLKVLVLNTLLALHPVHVTLTTISQAPGSDTLKVFFRMYYDDFVKDYKLFDPGFSPEIKPEDNAVSDGQLDKYFNNRVSIYIDSKLLTGKLVSVSNDGYEICLTLCYKSAREPGKLKIRNDILFRLYSDQVNMIFISINKYEAALRLTSKHRTDLCKLQ